MQWEKNIINVRGGENDTREGECPPLNTALIGVNAKGDTYIYTVYI